VLATSTALSVKWA
jgi:hypothetical protein